MNSFALPNHRGVADLPREIYISFVAALYGELRSLIIGSLAATCGALLIAWKTSDPYLCVGVTLIVAVAAFRACEMRRYRRVDPGSRTDSDTRRWEIRYVVAAAVYVGLLSVFCMLTFVRTTDAFSQMLSLSTVIAYHIGVLGRNYAHDRLINSQILSSAVPLAIGLGYAGGYFFFIALLVLLPLFVAMRLISAGLKNTLLKAVVSANDYATLAQQFDTALTNIPHGLIMFDSRQRAVVWNQSLHAVLRNHERSSAIECLDDLLDSCPFGGNWQAVAALKKICLSTSAGQVHTADFETSDGRYLAATVQGADNNGFVVCFEDITERRLAEQKVQFLAKFDSLTTLINRHGLEVFIDESLGKNIQSTASIWVLFIDLDNFKCVNDTIGHHHGDDLLREVARRLTMVIGAEGKTARFGGDEFVVCLPSANEATAVRLAQASIAALSKPYQLGTHQFALGASVGMAASGDGAVTKEQLLRQADTALYQAKADGKGIWRIFERQMAEKAYARQAIETDIRQAVEKSEFYLAYQPLIDMKSHRIRACEALLRWDHPVRGAVSPAQFIPVVEELGLIIPLGQWVLETACRQCLAWPEDVRVAVNISSLQFRHGNLLETVRETLLRTGLPPSRLELEITESVLFQNEAAALLEVAGLSELGVRIALDDFGTGYSSLSYLRWLKLDKIKIDRSFVRDIEQNPASLKLIAGIVGLASELGLSVTVEGVETPAQLQLLEQLAQVDELQGYLFSRPLPASQLSPLMTNPISKFAAA